MTIYKAVKAYYFNCRDCGNPLCAEKERAVGYCLHCFQMRVKILLTMLPVLRVSLPPAGVRRN